LEYNRTIRLPVRYEDLLRYDMSVPLMDERGTNTLWETVYYHGREQEELHNALTRVYALLKTDGDMQVLDHLTVARIDFCTFGNTRPFRIRIINRLNDNYDHFYVKKADASRVYGLELESILSPNRIIFLVDDDTLIEEHVAGIPGDDFMESQHLQTLEFNQTRIVKEFIKFNERCFVRLLGDMRAYNYVVDITPDIAGNQYRIRAIDFDQQSYEGRKKFYLPQYFRENNPIIYLGIGKMAPKTVKQYQLEERTLIGMRAKASKRRFDRLMNVMSSDDISEGKKVERLKVELEEHHKNKAFQQCRTMGQVVQTNIELVLEKAFRQSLEIAK
ncbi:MAG: hypothetical protein AAGK47_10590, partial [Bacteroidota bacterium]